MCANSFSAQSVAPEDHHHWFQIGLSDPNRLLLIATAVDGCAIGQIRFARQPASAQADSIEARVVFYLDRCARGHGLSAELVRLGLQEMEQRWGTADKAEAELLSSNTASNACFAHADFTSDLKHLLEDLPQLPDGDLLALAPGRITLLSDRGSWLNAFLPNLIIALWERGHSVRWIHTPSALSAGDVCLLLSCGRLLNADQLALHSYNLVVHESALPLGQGWSR